MGRVIPRNGSGPLAMGTHHLLQDQAADLPDEDGVMFEDAISGVESLDYEVVESVVNRENQVGSLRCDYSFMSVSGFVPHVGMQNWWWALFRWLLYSSILSVVNALPDGLYANAETGQASGTSF